MATTDSITGTSISTPIMVASAAPDWKPEREPSLEHAHRGHSRTAEDLCRAHAGTLPPIASSSRLTAMASRLAIGSATKILRRRSSMRNAWWKPCAISASDLAAADADGEVHARIIKHPLRVIRLGDGRFGRKQRRVELEGLG